MKGPTLDNIFIPQTEGYLKVTMVQEGQYTDVHCYYFPEFTSTLLYDNDVLCSNKFSKEYCGQLMLNFFEPQYQQEQIKNQKLDKITKSHDSHKKAYSNNQVLKQKSDFLSMRSIYKHQKSVSSRFHQLLIHSWIHSNNLVNAFTEKAHAILWHQRLLHLLSGTINEAYKYVNGVPNLSQFNFVGFTNCTTSTKANICKNSPTNRSISEIVTCPS